MSKGVLRISILASELSKAKSLTQNQLSAQFRVGKEKHIFLAKDKSFNSSDAAIFDVQEKELLEIYIYNSGAQGAEEVVYGEVKLHPLLGISNTKHHVTVHTTYKDKGILKDESSGTINVEIIYIQALDSLLQINVQSASLFRDTEIIGKMDPYVELKINEVIQKTSVKNDAGKQPVWNETCYFNLNGVDSTLHISVKDQDVTKSDIVGTAELSIRDSGFVKPTQEWVERVVDIFFDGKVSGKLNISSRFAINFTKK